METSSTIGANGAHYATLGLWYSDHHSILAGTGDTELNAEVIFIDPGVINVSSTLWMTTWNSNLEGFSYNFNFKAGPSALHNGNWDEGVIFSSTNAAYHRIFFAKNDFSLTFEDLTFIDSYFLIHMNAADASATHHGQTTYNRCLFKDKRDTLTSPILLEWGVNSYVLDPSSNVSATGSSTLSFNNCVIDDLSGAKYSGGVGTPLQIYNYTYYGDHTINFNGCTLRNAQFRSFNRLTDLSSNNVYLNLSGCIEDTSGAIEGRGILPQHPTNFYTTYPSNLNGTLIDHITTEPSSTAYDWAQTKTNVSYQVPFNFDGTVTSGQVNFVDNGTLDLSSFRDYRLVADVDNLPIKYATNSTIPTLDAANKARCELTDAGAFQSISNRVISSEVGASSLGHARDGEYATVTLWNTSIPTRNSAGEASALNGDIYEAVLLEGDHAMWTNVNFDNRLDFTKRFKGEVSHKGVRGAGAQLIQPSRGQLFHWGKHDISYEFDDISILWGGTWMWTRADDTTLDHTFNVLCNNCMLLADVTVDSTTLELTSNASADWYGNWMGAGLGLYCGTLNHTFRKCLLKAEGIAAWTDITNKGHLELEGCTLYAHSKYGVMFYGRSDVTASIKGSLAHLGSTKDVPQRNIPTLWAFSPSNVICTDFLSDEFNLSWADASNTTNSSANIVFNYDGTVTNGQVNYVASGGSGDLSSLDFRLVADPDNLPVRYMDLSSMYVTCSKDITGFRRPGSTDPGAYQSISDRVISGTIGTGGTHASFSIFWNSQSSDQFLNGDTYRAIFKEDEYVRHALEPTYNFPTKEVNLNIEIVGETPHNGNWGVGAQFLEGIVSIIGGEACRQDVNFLLKDVICRQTEGIDFHNNHFHQFNQRCGDYTGLFSRNPLIDQFTENVYHSKIMHENCLISLGSSASPILGNSGRNFATLGHDCVIDDRPGEHPRPYNDVNTYTLNYTPNIIERGSLTLGFNNCLILGDKFGQGISRIDNFSRHGKSNYYLEMIGCTVRDVQSVGTDVGLNKIHYDLNGCLIETSGVGGQTDSFIYYGWQGTESIDQSTFRAKDCIFSQSSSTLVNLGGFQIPAGSGILENSIASGFVVNTQFGVPFTYDGTVSSNQVGFQAGGGDLSTLRTYNLVADRDNLAVQYIDTSKDSFIGRRDIVGEPRPGDGDIGAFQSISNTVSSFTVGPSANYDTFTLMYSDIKDDIMNGDTIEAEFLSGTHTLTGYYINNPEVNHDFILKAHTSAHHNGDWNSGVNFSGGSFIFQPTNYSFGLTLKDIVVKNAESKPTLRIYGTPNKSGSYTYKHIMDSCLIETDNRFAFNSTWTGGQTLDDSGNVIEAHRKVLSFNNCAIHGLNACQSVGVWGSVSPEAGHIEANCIGTTFAKLDDSIIIQGFFDLGNGGNAEDGSLTYNISGSLIGGRFTHFTDVFQGNGLNCPKVFNFADSIFDDDPLGDPIVINFTLNETNVDYFRAYNGSQVPFNFDGTVTSGQVNFVDNGSASSLPDLRLVADFDNLPIKYMTQDSHTYKDVAGYKRPAGTDQRDAGAFQSISDQVTVRNIGTSSADFTPDYATASLWDSTYYDNANVLNGETHVLRLKSGEGHSLGNLNVKMDGQADVNQSFILSGHEPHNGVWEEGAILDDQSGFLPDTGANNFSIKFKDIVVSGTTSGTGYTRPLTQRLGSTTHEQGNAATEHTFEFENCLIRYISTRSFGSNSSPQLNYGNNKGYITDDDGNIIERGVTHHIFKNCVVIHPYPTSAYFGGFVILGGEFASTNTNATFLAEGCTFINSQVRPNRYWDRFQFSAIGCITYNEPSAHSRFTTEGGHSFFIDGGTSRDPDDFIIKDCIFNRGAGNVLLTQNTSDDRLTFWLAEPLASEYVNDPSVNFNSASVSANANNYYWPRVNATNMSIRVPFNFDGSVSAGTVSFVSGGASNYRLVADPDNLSVEYMDLSSFSEQKDVTGRRRPGLTNPGAYQMYDDSTVSAIIGSGVDGVSADFASVQLLESTSANDILNGQTIEAVLQDQPHNLDVYIGGSLKLKEVDQHWILRGDTTQDGLWDTGARSLSGANQYIFNGHILRNAFSLELRDIVINNPNDNVYIRFGQGLEGSIHDTELFLNRCLFNSDQDLHYAHPSLVSLIGDEYNTHTLKIFDSVITSPPSGYNARVLDSYYYARGGGSSFAAKGNHNVHIKGSTIFNKMIGRGHFSSPFSNNTVKIEDSMLAKWVPNGSRIFYATNADYTITDTLLSNSQSYEYNLPGNLVNVGFDTTFYFDNLSHNDGVVFIGSALGGSSVYNNGDLDFRLGGNFRDIENAAIDYVGSADDFGPTSDPGAFQYDGVLLRAIHVNQIPLSQIGYKVNINK